MKEEEVDQYFKNKFSGFAPAPSADAWARLQSKLEPPLPKRNTMWVYYAAAAVTLLLLSGALVFWLNTQSVNPTGNLARQMPVISPIEPKLVDPVVAAAVTGQDELFQIPEILALNGENSQTTKTRNTTATTGKPVKKRKKIRPGILIAAAPKTFETTSQSVAPAAAEKKVTPAAVVTQPSPTLASNQPPAAKVLEVVIKKDAGEIMAQVGETEFETASALRNNLAKKGKLVKNIFKQARNLKNGDKVELSTLGLNANYRIDVESKILKQKYTKVINL